MPVAVRFPDGDGPGVPMTVKDQFSHVQNFFADGLKIIADKGRDYAPENIAMIDVFYAAAEMGIRPQQVLWIYVRKHLTALRAWMQHGSVHSEAVHSRLLDVANYMAMIDFVNQHSAAIVEKLATYNDDPTSDLDETQRTTMRAWLHGGPPWL